MFWWSTWERDLLQTDFFSVGSSTQWSWPEGKWWLLSWMKHIYLCMLKPANNNQTLFFCLLGWWIWKLLCVCYNSTSMSATSSLGLQDLITSTFTTCFLSPFYNSLIFKHNPCQKVFMFYTVIIYNKFRRKKNMSGKDLTGSNSKSILLCYKSVHTELWQLYSASYWYVTFGSPEIYNNQSFLTNP